MWGSIGQRRFFADPVPFAGPIGSPMMGSKWKKIFLAYRGLCVCRLYVKLGHICGLKLKSGPQLETIGFSQTPSPSQALLAHPWWVPSEKKSFSRIRRSLCVQILRQIGSNFWPEFEKRATVGDHRCFSDSVPFAGPIGSPMMGSKWNKNSSCIRWSFCIQILRQIRSNFWPWKFPRHKTFDLWSSLWR